MGLLEQWRQIAPSIIASLGSASQGMAVAFPSSALPQMTDPASTLYLTEAEASLMVGIFSISSAAGTTILAVAGNTLSRKYVLAVSAVPFVCGFILVALASNFHMLLLGRTIIGIAAGANYPMTPVYISEITEPEMRSYLGTFPTLFFGIGSLLEYILGIIAPNWRVMTWIGTAIPIFFMLCMPFMPRSPRYLLMKNKEEEAVEALGLLRSKHADASKEILLIKEQLSETNFSINVLKSLSKKYILKSLFFAVVLGILFAVSGGGIFVQYAEPLSIAMCSAISPKLVSVILGFIVAGCSLLSLLLADTFGRRRFLQASGIIMFLTSLCLVIFFSLLPPYFSDHPSLLYFPPIFLIVFMGANSFGYNTMAFVIGTEVLPSEVRSFGSFLSSTVSLSLLAILSYGYTYMMDYLGLTGYFSIISATSLICFLFPTLFLPETRGKTLEQIENEMKSDTILLGLHTL